jgi:hypothetical protein
VSLHVFVDESHRGSLYLLAAAVLRPSDLDQTRVLMRSLRVPGERKLHFKSERDTVKKDIAAAIVSARVRTRIYVGHGQADAVREQVSQHSSVILFPSARAAWSSIRAGWTAIILTGTSSGRPFLQPTPNSSI